MLSACRLASGFSLSNQGPGWHTPSLIAPAAATRGPRYAFSVQALRRAKGLAGKQFWGVQTPDAHQGEEQQLPAEGPLPAYAVASRGHTGMAPIISDSLTVVTRITRQCGRLVVVPEPQADGFSEDQLDALRVAIAVGRRHIAAITSAEQEAFQQKVAGYTPAPG